MEDKIFNNNYGNVEFETGDIKFELDPAVYNEVYQDLNLIKSVSHLIVELMLFFKLEFESSKLYKEL